jgi:hypothetical protein
MAARWMDDMTLFSLSEPASVLLSVSPEDRVARMCHVGDAHGGLGVGTSEHRRVTFQKSPSISYVIWLSLMNSSMTISKEDGAESGLRIMPR